MLLFSGLVSCSGDFGSPITDDVATLDTLVRFAKEDVFIVFLAFCDLSLWNPAGDGLLVSRVGLKAVFRGGLILSLAMQADH